MTSRKFLAITIVLTSITSVVGAESLEEKMQRKGEKEMLQDSYIRPLNDTCETKIVATWDFPSFKGKLRTDVEHVAANCGQAIDGVKGLCYESDEAKDMIRKGIKTIHCRGGAEETTLTLKGTTLTIATSLGQKRTDVDKYARDYVAKNLK